MLALGWIFNLQKVFDNTFIIYIIAPAGNKFLPSVNCDLDIGDMTLRQGHDTIVWYII